MFSELQHSPSTQPSQDKTVQDSLTSKHTQLEESVGETEKEQDQPVQQACTERSISHKDQIEHIDTRDKEDMESDTLVLYKDETKVVESKHEEVVRKDNPEKNVLKENAKETKVTVAAEPDDLKGWFIPKQAPIRRYPFGDCPHPRAPRLLSFPQEPLSLDSLKYYLSANQTGHSPPHPGGEGVMTVTPCSFSSRQPRHTTYRHVTSPECAPIRVPPPTATVTDKRQKRLK